MIPLSLDRLVPGEKYLVIINWNEHGNFRFDNEYRFFGEFERLQFVRGRTRSYDSGLQLLLSPNRTNAIFNCNGRIVPISSANTFYKIYRPLKKEIESEYFLRKMKICLDMKRMIRKYMRF